MLWHRAESAGYLASAAERFDLCSQGAENPRASPDAIRECVLEFFYRFGIEHWAHFGFPRVTWTCPLPATPR